MAITIFSFSASAQLMTLPTVTVMADSNLGVVVAEIARDYSKENNISVNNSFLSQNAQQEQINEGSAADILITAKQDWIEELKSRGLIDIYSPTNIASDKLVLIGPSSSKVVSMGAGRLPTNAMIEESSGNPMFLLGNPENLLEGVYGKESMRSLGIASDFERYTLYIKDLEQIFDMVANQNAFAICFHSSTIGRKGIRIIDYIPEVAHKSIDYYAVVIAGDNMDQARNFLNYLKSDKVKKIFRKYGFFTN
ncbi:MAG: molybdate ABC transporter substrate-binding protein [Rickettsiales bacterium]